MDSDGEDDANGALDEVQNYLQMKLPPGKYLAKRSSRNLDLKHLHKVIVYRK